MWYHTCARSKSNVAGKKKAPWWYQGVLSTGRTSASEVIDTTFAFPIKYPICTCQPLQTYPVFIPSVPSSDWLSPCALLLLIKSYSLYFTIRFNHSNASTLLLPIACSGVSYVLKYGNPPASEDPTHREPAHAAVCMVDQMP